MVYKPAKLPNVSTPDGQAIASYFENELQTLASQMTSPNTSTQQMNFSYSAPSKPRTGMIAYADGVHWNPGSGEGLYTYNSSGVWVKNSSKSFNIVYQTFTVSGTYTPTAGMVLAEISCYGGGGQGGGVAGVATRADAGGGGASGGKSVSLVTAAAVGVSQVVTIGAGGSAAGAGANVGTQGGSTSVGSLCVANGGTGGNPGGLGLLANGGTGLGSGAGNVSLVTGKPGFGGYSSSTTTPLMGSGAGGCTDIGVGGYPAFTASGSGINGIGGTSFGGGGSGAMAFAHTGNQSGGPGASGGVLIKEYIFA